MSTGVICTRRVDVSEDNFCERKATEFTRVELLYNSVGICGGMFISTSLEDIRKNLPS